MNSARSKFLLMMVILNILPVVGLIVSCIFKFIPGMIIAPVTTLLTVPLSSMMAISSDIEQNRKVEPVSSQELVAENGVAAVQTKTVTKSNETTKTTGAEIEK